MITIYVALFNLHLNQNLNTLQNLTQPRVSPATRGQLEKAVVYGINWKGLNNITRAGVEGANLLGKEDENLPGQKGFQINCALRMKTFINFKENL